MPDFELIWTHTIFKLFLFLICNSIMGLIPVHYFTC